ncbi:hypothetical protein LWI29_016541 [Acer saccharum]|uniref:Pentatricopeptide repeat-containing protein n=1 Tax=Acer saccharum TaxID=4024 RepID=A0AA39VKW2_ACESA|nr:hypothetical protein LWI29_016541 [Acer saccharum]
MVSDDTNESNTKKDEPLYCPWLPVSYGKQGNRNFKGRHGRTGYGNTNSADRNGSFGKFGGSNSGRKKDGEIHDARIGKSDKVQYDSNNLKSDMAKKTATTRGSGSRLDILHDELDEMVLEKKGLSNNKDAGVTFQKDKIILSEITNHSNRKGDSLIRASFQNSKKKTKKLEKLGGNDSFLSKNSKIEGVGSSKGSCSSSYTKDRNLHQEIVHLVTENDDNGSDNVLRQLHKDVTEFEIQSLKNAVTTDRICGNPDMPNENNFDMSVISSSNSMWVSTGVLSCSRKRLFTSDLLRYVEISLEKCSFRVSYSASSALLWKDHVFDCSPNKVEANVVESNVIDKISVPRKWYRSKKESKLYPLIVKVYKSLSWEVAREMRFFNAVNRYGYPHSIYAFRIIAHIFALAAMEMEVYALLTDIVNYNREAKMDMYELFPSLLDSHEHAWRSAIVCSELMKVFVFDAMLENAMDVFVQSKKFGLKPNIKSCNFLLELLVGANRLNSVRCFFEELKNSGPSPDVYTYNIMLNFYFKGHLGRDVDILQATDLFEDMERYGVRPTVVTYGTCIHGLCRVGCVESALKFIRSLIHKNQPVNTYCYNAVIRGFCQKGEMHEALNVVEEMKNHGISANDYTSSILIDRFCKKGDIENGLRMIEEMELCNIKPSLVCYNSLLHCLCKSGQMDSALNLFRDLGASGYEYDMIAYSILINGYCMQGHLENALELINEMKEQKDGIKPSIVTYVRIPVVFNWLIS